MAEMSSLPCFFKVIVAQKREKILITFPSCVTKLHGKTKVKTNYPLLEHPYLLLSK
jgi:hypothetical protein